MNLTTLLIFIIFTARYGAGQLKEKVLDEGIWVEDGNYEQEYAKNQAIIDAWNAKPSILRGKVFTAPGPGPSTLTQGIKTTPRPSVLKTVNLLNQCSTNTGFGKVFETCFETHIMGYQAEMDELHEDVATCLRSIKVVTVAGSLIGALFMVVLLTGLFACIFCCLFEK